ncbi:MAG: hypothetical protein EPO39_11945 [Candidatus Manganitrophaceae bacterium]|nr:MAG: hypothetical protein EPO39_11945 [Candidatus Manganitrophaceae bacterium]
MFRPRSKKIALLFLAALYFTALILGTLCAFDLPTGQTHHHGRAVSHTASCLLACASTATDQPPTLPLTLSLLLIGMLLAFGRPLTLQPSLLRLHSRAPPV